MAPGRDRPAWRSASSPQPPRRQARPRTRSSSSCRPPCRRPDPAAASPQRLPARPLRHGRRPLRALLRLRLLPRRRRRLRAPCNYTPSTRTPSYGATGYLGQLAGIDALDGPCGLAFDATGRLYVNDYHRAVSAYGPLGSFGTATVFTGATTPEETHPTGVAVDPASGASTSTSATYVSVFDASGAPADERTAGLRSPAPDRRGHPPMATASPSPTTPPPRVTSTSPTPPPTPSRSMTRATDPKPARSTRSTSSETPDGKFVSLRDAAIAVDRFTGRDLRHRRPAALDTERPQAIDLRLHLRRRYEGHLKSCDPRRLALGPCGRQLRNRDPGPRLRDLG